MAGLLDYASSVAGEAKKNVQGLLADPKQALMDILNNLTARAAASQAKTKAAWATRDPQVMAQNALDSSQTALGFAPLGITAWHGSPHTFDKFSMDKIGTGEGAQAYGHGLYMAESPAVATEYKNKLGTVFHTVDGIPTKTEGEHWAALGLDSYKNALEAKAQIKRLSEAGYPSKEGAAQFMRDGFAAVDRFAGRDIRTGIDGQLYKVDIPDEAVARFLDWDKPLSQQAPEVQKAVRALANHAPDGGLYRESMQSFEFPHMTGEGIERTFARDLATTGNGQPNKTFSMLLNEYGIPGIRYLDGGSRGAGQGSSNFVAFDPEMIRILERNGQATGAVPWQPGEWRGLLGK